MTSKSMRWLAIGLAVILLMGLFLIDSSAQRRRRKQRARRPSTPRITNPPIYEPPDEVNRNANNSTPEPTGPPTETTQDPETMKKTIRDLSSQVDKLTDKISQMEESQRALVDLERLSRAEQRSADLWKQLRDVQGQQADLQARLEEVDYALKPENIDRAVAGYGSTRPEEVRERRRQQLEGDKLRLRKQLDQLAASHIRLETAVAAADTEVERLRKRVEASEQAAFENAKTKTQTEGAAPVPTPSPTPK